MTADPNIANINAGNGFLPKKRNKTAGHINPRLNKKRNSKNKKQSLNLPSKMHRSPQKDKTTEELLQGHSQGHG